MTKKADVFHCFVYMPCIDCIKNKNKNVHKKLRMTKRRKIRRILCLIILLDVDFYRSLQVRAIYKSYIGKIRL